MKHFSVMKKQLIDNQFKTARNNANEVGTSENTTAANSVKNESIRITNPCGQCDKEFLTKFALNMHKRTKHHEDNSINCPFKSCRKTFTDITSFKQHKQEVHNIGMTNEHSLNKKFVCKGCKETFVTADFNKHTNCQRHRNQQCPFCEKCYLYKKNLRIHIKEDHQNKSIKCCVPNCTKDFKRREHAINHVIACHVNLAKEDRERYVVIIKSTPYTYSNIKAEPMDDQMETDLSFESHQNDEAAASNNNLVISKIVSLNCPTVVPN